MEIFSNLKINASGMEAERRRMEVISNNIANANTIKTKNGEMYRAQRLITAPSETKFGNYLAGFREFPGSGVNIMGVVQENTPPRLVYEPNHPEADGNGYVTYPDINILDEMVDSISAYRSYEANLTAFNETKRILNKSLEIGK